MSVNDRARIQNAAFLALSFALLVFAFYPGRFDGDASSAYQQGVSLNVGDSVSVWVSLLLGSLSDLAPGPGPMFLLQLALWAGGLLVLTDTLIAAGWRHAGQAISVLALTPLLAFDFFDIQKDALLTALLAVLLALGTRRLLLRPPVTLIAAGASAGLLLLAIDTRHNAFFALFPLWFLFWPISKLQIGRVAAVTVAGMAAFVVAHVGLSWFNHEALKARQDHFAYSLIVYDLSGIAVRTHQDASEGRLADFRANAERCYSIHHWDAFIGGPCQPIGLSAQQRMMTPEGRRDLVALWARQIAFHPVAYAAHRVRHFGCLLSVGCQRQAQVMSSGGWWVRPWDEPHMRFPIAARVLGKIAAWMWRGPLGSGLLWLGVLALELAIAAFSLRKAGFHPAAYLALAVSGAGLSYLLSFALVGIADEMRYLHPVIFLGVAGLPLALSALGRTWPQPTQSAMLHTPNAKDALSKRSVAVP